MKQTLPPPPEAQTFITPTSIEITHIGPNTNTLARLIGSGDINKKLPGSGLTALHIAIGSHSLKMVKTLVEAGAAFLPDNEGRMPSYIAAEMEVSEELADYIVEAERRALQAQGQEDV